ncbi:MAG: ribonuclease R [candidate division Zixibacteria bacterium RBG_16_40_9]|nr:MAG: ribonuclease R [candidate division Zixibacteria bacterium RBG_16_40_9]
MSISKAQILEFLKKSTYRPFKLKELAREMKVPQVEYRSFRGLVKELIQEGHLIKLKKNRLGLPDKLSLKVGKLSTTKAGYGFVVPDDGSPDIYIHSENMGTALNGDKVKVRVFSKRNGKSPQGTIIEVLTRSNPTIIGTLKKTKYFGFVEPDDPKITRDIYIPPEYFNSAQVGQKVVVQIDNWLDPHLSPEGKIIEVLGFPEEKGIDILTIIKEFQLPLDFTPAVLREVEKIEPGITPAEIRNRKDFRSWNCFTIDPINAKDHDDAVSLQKLKNGNWLLGVHIADVSFYVKENSALDKEALARGTSVYLVDRVIPMLPEKLSNEICSLKARKERLTYSCLMELDENCQVVDYQIQESVIESKTKLTYEEVQAFFDTGKSTPQLKGLEEDLVKMLELSQKLLKKREALGSLDFDLPEALVILDSFGNILDIYQAPRLDSHRLIEEFMLMANKTVALHVTRLAMPFLYRVHAKPDPEKLKAFSELVSQLGYKTSLGEKVTPRLLQRFLKQVEGKPEEPLINELLLRSLKKAVYQPENVGHFGLAFTHYTHFTSPIRRYPDLIVHRLLKELKKGQYTPERYHSLMKRLPRIGEIASEREKIAEEAERSTIKLKQVQYMQDKLGEVFEGVISGVVPYGFFVRLQKLLVEGLVRLSSIDDDYYIYDESGYRVIGKHTKKVYRLGDKVTVKVIRVDKEQHQLDFVLANNFKKRKK